MELVKYIRAQRTVVRIYLVLPEWKPEAKHGPQVRSLGYIICTFSVPFYGQQVTCFMHLRWAADPTRDTESPTEIAGR